MYSCEQVNSHSVVWQIHLDVSLSYFQWITKTIIVLRLATTGRAAYTPLAEVLYEIEILNKKNKNIYYRSKTSNQYY